MALPTFVEVLRSRAAESPEARAYTFLDAAGEEAATLTFADLDRRARTIAAHLQAQGAAGERALLLYPPGLEFVAAFLGCLYAGVVAVPAYPPRSARTLPRLLAVAADARPRFALTESTLLPQLRAMGPGAAAFDALTLVATDVLDPAAADAWRQPAVTAESLAFLQYTSGSTAAPKGVMVSHRNLLHNEEMIRRAFGQSARSVVVGWLPLYHDMGLIGCVLQPLYLGARAVLMSPVAFLQRPARWLQAISRYRATTSGGPNFAYELCASHIDDEERSRLDLASWEVAFNGAEPVRAETLERFARRFGPAGFRAGAWYPCYGLAEATLFVAGPPRDSTEPPTASVAAAALEQGRAVPAAAGEAARTLVGCGTPWLGQEVAIVEPESRRPLGAGEVGEIWVRGPSVAGGYWRRPEETARDFGGRLAPEADRAAEPAVAGVAEGEPYLRTGDLGFADGAGRLFVTGRLKDLIILRGRNLYPQDVERTVEASHRSMRKGCGAAFAVDLDGAERLVVVQEVDRHAKDLGEIADAARAAVAAEHEAQLYDLLLVREGAVPKTSSGKVQRRACRAAYLDGSLASQVAGRLAGRPVGEKAAEPAPPAERKADEPALPAAREMLLAVPVEARRPALATLLGSRLARILGVPSGQLAADRPLTASGLDSLRAIELCHVVETELGVALPMAWLLEGATPTDLAGEVLRRLAEAPAGGESEKYEDGAPGAVSPGQRALWLLDRLAPESAAYVLAGAARVVGDVDGAVLHRALDTLAARHPALSTVFAESAGEPAPQPIAGPAVEWLEEDGAAWSDEELARRLADRAYRPFDLAAGPLLRAGLVARGRREPVLWLAVHHIAADFWSVEVLLGELARLYRAAGRAAVAEGAEAAEAALPPAPRPPYATAHRSTDAETQRLLAFWRAALADKSQVLELPTDRPRGKAQSFRGDWRTARLPADLTRRLRELGRAESATLFVTLAAGFGALLARTSGQDEPLFGTPTFGRGTAELAGAVGYFVNPVVLAADLSGDPSAAELLARTRRTALAAFAHQELPFPLIAEQQAAERDPSRSPIFQAMLVLQGGRGPLGERLAALALGAAGAAGGTGSLDLEHLELGHLELDLGGLRLAPLPLAPRGAQLDLTLACGLLPGETAGGEPAGLAAALTFNADLFDGATAERLLGHFAALLDGMAADPAARVWELPLLSPSERAQLAAWGGGEGGAPPAVCLHELFALQAARTPEATALVAAGEELTYRELARRVAGLSAVLRAAGVAPEVRVGICLERTPAMIVALLAVLAAGGAYVPLDPAYPRDRLAFTAADSGMTVLLTQAALRGRVPEDGLRVIVIEEAEAAAAAPPLRGALGEAAGEPLPGNLAYVIYTSGSTGRPKGVAIEHATAVVFVEWARSVFSAEELAGVLAATSICFDLSIFEIFVPLASGGAVVLAASALELPELAAPDRVTLVDTVPSAMAELLGGGRVPASVRTVSLGGEPLTPSLAEAIRRRTRATRLVNLYGPSEATTCSTWWAAPLAAGGEPPAPTIGRPIAGSRVHLLGPGLAPVPAGVAGEVWIGGRSVSRGYLGRPELTAERFLPDPFAAAPGRRLYRVGDLARWRPDGELEFLGRVDHQVKIRGFRVEPGEVEAALEALPGVGAAAVVARPAGEGELRLVAYAVLAPGGEPGSAATAESLRRDLSLRLPQHLVPAAVVLLPELPRTPNGKLDRRRLPEPEWSDGAPPVAPRTPLEARLAAIFGEVLGIAAVGIHDSFFALGGHSLLAARALARVRAELGLELPLRALFESPTVAALALAVERAARAGDGVDGVEGAGGDAPPVRGEPRVGEAPLSFAQERLWFLDRLEPGSALYNLPAAVELRGRLSVPALAASLTAIAARHEILRTSYGERDGQPLAVVAARPVGWLAVVDLAPLAPARRAGEAARLAAAEALRPFDLAAGPPLRAALLRLADEEHVLLATFHHIAADGWSIAVFVRELSALYGAALESGRQSASLAGVLPELPLQYADHAARERRELAGAALERQIAYWRQRLEGAPAVLDLPTDRPRTAAPDLRGGLRRLTLPDALAADLQALARDQGATLFMVLLAGVESLLGAHCGQDDLLLGTPVANRGRLDVEGLIGLFVNTLVLRADLAGEPTGAELVARAREASLGAFAHQRLPFERLVEALAPERELGRAPLVQALFALQNAPAERLALPGLAPARLPEAGGLAKLELEIEAEEVAGEGLVLRMRYRRELFDATTIDRLAGHLARRLAGLAAEPGRRAADLPLLSAAERAQLLVEWSDSSFRPSAAAETVVGLFAAQAARTPAAVALRSGAVAVTYGALAARAGHVARRLRRLGVRPGDRVGLCAERSPDLAAGLLAIFQSGGAFLPLDPGYPAERLRFVLGDAAPSVVVGEEALLRSLPAHGAATLALDDAEDLSAASAPESAELPMPAAPESAALPAPCDLAYVIYTSGSTGRPKGVAVEHGSLANRLAASRDEFGWRAGDAGAVVAPFSFDIFLFELLAPLVAGGSAVLVPLLPALDVEALVDGLPQLTHLHAVPALMRQVAAAARRRGLAAPRLRTLLVGGDTVPLDLLREMRAAFPAAAIRVLYGPTEATILATSWTIGPGEPPTRSLLGGPLGNVEVGVRDAGGRPQPIGVAGELWIGGAGVARGYLGRPELTAERFVAAEGRRWLRSGDRARFLASGELEFLGRLDQQVKIRGFRIEPGEVEAALAEHPAVAVAAVVGVAAGDGEGPRLVAYVVPRREGGDAAALAADLRAHLALRLPAYMVPAAFVALPELPLTSHGKLDLRRLPAPEWRAGETAGPRTPIEELVAGLWSEVLGLPRVGLDDDFFAAGGHSLLATRLVSRLREALGVEIPLRALFESPTVAGLARRLEAARREAAGRTADSMALGASIVAPTPPPIPPTPRPEDGTPLPLSFAQERLWFLDRLAPGGSAYNLAAAVRLRGGLEVAALAAAFREIARRHEVLGATYAASGGTPFQRAGAGAAPELPRVDLSGLAADLSGLPAAAAGVAEATLAALAAAEAERPFDLARGPLLRTVLLRRSAADHLLVVTMHHIVSDGWSMGILVHELGALYAAAVARRPRGPAPLAAPPIQYADYAAWQRRWMAGEVLAGELAHWRAVLAGLPEALELPADRPRPAVQSFRGAERGFALPPALWSGLGAAARRSGVTLYMLLLAAFDVLLYRLTGQRDLAVGSPIAGRTRGETEGLIGLFVNTLVLRGEIAEDDTLATLLPRLRETALTAYAHQELPFEKLVEALAPARDLARSALVQVMLALQNAPLGALTLPGLTLEPLRLAGRAAKLDLTLSVVEADGGAIGYWEHATDLFDRATIARLAERFAALLAGAVVDLAGAAARRHLDDLPLLSAAERQQLREWNDTPALPAELAGTTLYGLIAAQIERTPGAVAVSLAGDELTYRQLGDAAERLARRLAGLGVGPGVLVGLCAERSLELMVGLVAILAAGAAYVPLDPAYPAERLAFMVEDAAVGVLLTHGAAARALPPHGAALVELDLGAFLAAAPEEPDARPARSEPRLPAADPDDLAYVIYTSGSTGKPKGAMNSHRAVVNRLLWMQRAFGLTGEDRVLQKTPISFDVSVWELFWPLLAGARLVLARPGGHQDAAYLARLVAEERITTVHFVPSMLQAFLAAPGVEACTSLRRVVASGEALPRELARRLAERNPAPLWNLYGPTEAAVDVTFRDCREGAGDGEGGSVPIGRPISGVEIRLLDPSLRPVPVGAAGELAIGGLAPGRGYWRRPDLTAERFVPDPLSAPPGGRLYRTGDLARFLADGSLDYLGRLDDQVKVRGVRVELGEIEAALAAHPAVAEAVVMLRPELPGGGLAAYLAPRPQAEPGPGLNRAELDRAELRRYLAARLPEAMVPAAFVLLAALPLTPSGKADRRALPAPSAAHRGAGGVGSVAPGAPPRPLGPTEELLAGIWAEVLGIDAVSIDDDFFALGGHSLLATQVLARLERALAVELPVAALFAAPTIAALAELVEEAQRPEAAPARAAVPPLAARPAAAGAAGELPLSFGQERLWFLDRLTPGGAAYNVPVAIRLRGALDAAALAGAFGEIVRRHESLRTTFAAGEGGAWQRVHPPSPAALSRIDLGALPAAARMAAGVSLAKAEAKRPFDLACGPLLRTALVRLSGPDEAGEAGDHLLLVTMHHIVSDAWSLGVLVRELGVLYAAARERRPSPLAELPIQYADYAAWQRRWMAGEVLAGELAHWRERLAGLPPALELPADRPRPPEQSFRGAELGVPLPAALWSALGAAARRSGVTVYMLLLAAFDVLLYRHTGQRDLAVGSPIAGRTRAETFELIGLFVNTLVLRAEIADDDTLATLLPRLRETALAAYAHQELPFEKLVEALAPARDLARSPVVQVMLALQNAPLGALALPGLAVEPLPAPEGAAKLDLSLSVGEKDGRAVARWEHATDLFDRTTIARLAGRYAVLLEGAVADLAAAGEPRRLDDLPLLTAAERQQLREWNDTAVEPAAAELCLHDLVAAQIARTPDALAVSCGGATLTYRQLGAAAGALAARLRRLGVGPDVVVGVCAERSREMVVGLLAVLVAGGAYLPLDVSQPADRLARMIEDAAPTALLTHGAVAPSLPAAGARRLTIELEIEIDDEVEGGSETPDLGAAGGPAPRPAPDHLAYVMYTSGSTGRPKGVAVPHRGLVRTIRTAMVLYGVDAGDRVLQFGSPSFDLSALELFTTLASGACVWIPPPGPHLLGADLAAELRREAIAAAFLTPSVLATLEAGETLPDLRLLATGAEPCPPELARRWAPGRRFLNLYGPTEASIFVSAWQAGPAGEAPTLGRPAPGARVHVIAGGRPAPVGVPGEVLLGGLGLARGYFHRPGRTAESFVPDPFSASGERLYRTGDLARWLADGQLEFLGRIDHQVKVRGVRIELGEVEAVLGAHPAVARAVVLLRSELPGGGRGGLVAYLTRRDGRSEPPDAELRDDLRAFLAVRLPEPMIPNAFVLLAAMPLTAAGKLDRRAILAIEPGLPGLAEGGGYVAPRNPVEALFAGIWTEVLGTGRQEREISVHDNFFELGGNSILSLQIVARAARAGCRITPRQLFEQQTVARLAAVAGTAAEVLASQGPVTGPLPLTPIQRWFFGLDLADPHHFNQAVLLAVREIGPRVAESALGALVLHHDALRLRISPAAEDGSEPRAENAPPEPGFFLPRVDLAALGPADAERALGASAGAAQASLDLARGPLLRFLWYQLGEGEARLLLAVHHLAVDGVSWRILLEDLETACRQIAARGPSALRLPAKTTSFKEWAERLAAYARGLSPEAVERELGHWSGLAGLPVDRLPFEPAEPTERTDPFDSFAPTAPLAPAASTGLFASARTVTVELDAAETRALLTELPSAYGTQVNDALLAALAATLARPGGALWVDLEGHGREEVVPAVDLSRTVGWFTTLFPVALAVDSTAPGALLQSVKEQLRAIPDRGFGYGVLRYLRGGEAAALLAALPAPRVSFNYLGEFDGSFEGGLFAPAAEPSGAAQSPRQRRPHALAVSLLVASGRLRVDWGYSADLCDRGTIERLAATYAASLRELIAHCRAAGTGDTPAGFSHAELEADVLAELDET
jgi:amino acid adenylation domain-containing protein/non-ribosomal peptide synthase protein (TIGR01720 family)